MYLAMPTGDLGIDYILVLSLKYDIESMSSYEYEPQIYENVPIVLRKKTFIYLAINFLGTRSTL